MGQREFVQSGYSARRTLICHFTHEKRELEERLQQARFSISLRNMHDGTLHKISCKIHFQFLNSSNNQHANLNYIMSSGFKIVSPVGPVRHLHHQSDSEGPNVRLS